MSVKAYIRFPQLEERVDAGFMGPQMVGKKFGLTVEFDSLEKAIEAAEEMPPTPGTGPIEMWVDGVVVFPHPTALS